MTDVLAGFGPSRLLAIRGTALWATRLVGLLLVGWGLYLVMARLVFAWFLSPKSDSGFFGGVKVWMGIAEEHGWVRGWPMVILGVAICVASRRLVRWLIAMPDDGCPRCRHEVSARAPRCTECGQTLDG